jgi:MFS family permease
MESEAAPPPSRKALDYRSFRLFWAGGFLATFAAQIISVAVGWHVYDLTRNPLHLGYVGLVQFLPALLLVLVTGLAADRFNRRAIMAVCVAAEAGVALSLLWLVVGQSRDIAPIFLLLVVIGIARAFFNPASDSILPNIIPREAFANAIALNASSWQIAMILGPVTGGLIYGLGASVAFSAAFAMLAASAIAILLIPRPVRRETQEPATLATLLAGIRYIRSQKVVLGAISLDLFAVLLGGAVALMPVFARDILATGPWGLGLMRAAPGIGAVAVALWLTRHPIRDNAGKILFVFVAGFGFFTALFGVSTNARLSIAALMALGACDMVSVYIREVLLQLWTPDAVRGRVNAVNRVFVGASNELGEFRAGIVAYWVGAVVAVAAGGIATMGIAALWPRLFPQLRDARYLDRGRDD